MKGLYLCLAVLVNLIITVCVASVFLVLITLADPVVKIVNLFGSQRLAKNLTCRTARLVQWLPRAWGTRFHFHLNANRSTDIEAETEASSRLSADQWGDDKPIIFVSSHHSCFDIVLLTTVLGEMLGGRQFSFISRSGLDKYIPLISFYLRQFCFSLPRFKGGDRAQYQREMQSMLADFAANQACRKGAVVIFPEGVKDVTEAEHNAPFRRNGLRILLQQMPDAVLVPVAITGTRDFYTTGRKLSQLLHQLPKFSTDIQLSILPAVEADTIEKKIDRAEMQIAREYSRLKQQSSNRKTIAHRTLNWIL